MQKKTTKKKLPEPFVQNEYVKVRSRKFADYKKIHIYMCARIKWIVSLSERFSKFLVLVSTEMSLVRAQSLDKTKYPDESFAVHGGGRGAMNRPCEHPRPGVDDNVLVDDITSEVNQDGDPSIQSSDCRDVEKKKNPNSLLAVHAGE